MTEIEETNKLSQAEIDEIAKEIKADIKEMIGVIAKTNGVTLPDNDPVAILLTAIQYISDCYAKSTDRTVSELKKRLRDEMNVAKDEWYNQVNECANKTVNAVLNEAVQGVAKSLIKAQQEAFTKHTAEQMIGVITDGVAEEIGKTEKEKIRWFKFAVSACTVSAVISLMTLALVIAK